MSTLTKYDNCITTYTGKRFNFIDVKADDIDIVDIAKGLAYKPHFGGMTPKYFSIAEHCLLVEMLLPENCTMRDRLVALLHDGSEAYLGDMLKPIKVLLPEFCKIEDNLTVCILHKYGFELSEIKRIKPQDIQAQQMEYNAFFTETPIKVQFMYYTPDEAYAAYYSRLIHVLSLQ